MKEAPYHIQRLQADFSRRQKQNPSYSLRAFGRDIGIHPSTLSKVLKGTRPLPLSLGQKIAELLKLSPRESAMFTDSVIRKGALLDQLRIQDEERYLLDESHYRIIAEWEHYAILTLMDVEDFQSDEEWIAKRLGLPLIRVKAVLQNLLQADLLQATESGFQKIEKRFRTTEDVQSNALRASHVETLQLALTQLEKVALENRSYSSVTMAIDPARLSEFKSIIREFTEKASTLSQEGSKTEVYQLAVQFYPLTQINSKKEPSL